MIARREFIALVGGAAAWPLAARAQQAGRTYRVAIVAGGVNPTGGAGPVMGRGVPALLHELRRLGFSEGQNLTMDYRSTNRPVAQFALDLAEMVRAKPDVIVTGGAEPQLQAVMRKMITMLNAMLRDDVVWADRLSGRHSVPTAR